MKFRHTVAAAAATFALALTGCTAPADSGSEADATTKPSSDGAYPVTVETAFGDITIDEAPERIVALGWGDAEIALALDVQPVGASDWLGFGGDGVGPWAEGMYDESPMIIETLEPSYEAIAALDPDLIFDVRSSGDKDRYERLSEIATTVGVPVGGESYLASMDDHVALISSALGVPEKGKELMASVDDAYAAVADAHPEWEGKTVTAAAKTSEGWGAYIQEGGRLQTLNRFGFVQNPTIAALPADDGGFSVDISSEELDLLEADLIVAFPIFLESTAITDDPQWQQLAAVKEGRAVVIDGLVSNAFSASTPLAAIYAIDELTPLFEKAIPAE